MNLDVGLLRRLVLLKHQNTGDFQPRDYGENTYSGTAKLVSLSTRRCSTHPHDTVANDHWRLWRMAQERGRGNLEGIFSCLAMGPQAYEALA